MEDVLIPVVAITFGIGSFVYLVYACLELFRGYFQAKASREFSSKLLDRVSSAQDLAAVMSSEGGARLLATFAGTSTTAQTRILRALQSGLVLLVLGIGMFAYAFMSPTIPLEGFEMTTLFATLAVSLGVGLLLATGAALAMSRRLGLLDDQPGTRAHVDNA